MSYEYCPQMKRNGKWVSARQPFGGSLFIVSDKKVAERFIRECSETWKKARRDIFEDKDIPTEYRIMRRQVSDWEEA